MNLFSTIIKKIITIALVVIIFNSSATYIFGAEHQLSDRKILLAQISQILEAIRIKILAIAATLNEVTTEEAELVPTRTTVSPPPPPPPAITPPTYTPPPPPTPTIQPVLTPAPVRVQSIAPAPLPQPQPISSQPTDSITQIKNQIQILQARVRDLQRQLGTRTAPTPTLSSEPASQRAAATLADRQLRMPLAAGQLPLSPEPQYAQGSLLVKFKPGFTPNSVLEKVPPQFRFTESKRLFLARHQNNPLLRDSYELKIPQTADPRLAAVEYKKQTEVEDAEPNWTARTQQVPVQSVSIAPIATLPPNDPLYSQQWHLPKVKAEDAWSIETGNPNTVIAVIDTGVKWNHPDLAANIWTNTAEIPNNNIDDDNNGYIDDIRGWDFVDTTNPSCSPGEDCLGEDNNPDDFYGHGTHVAGIAAAVTNNGIGVAGACWFCKLMAVKAGYAVGNPSPGGGTLEYDDIAQALTYAADNGADIINMSFGGPASLTMENAINYAYGQGKSLVAAAGNSYLSEEPNYPAAYPRVIAVAATDQNDQETFFTTAGFWVDTAAPGLSILSTTIPGVTWGCQDTVGGGYGTCSGTSMAAPFVAGIIGLVKSKLPTLTQDQVWTLVQSSHDPIQSYFIYRPYIGAGRINAYKMVQPSTVPLAVLDNNLLDSLFITSGTVSITGTAGGQNFSSYELQIGSGTYPNVWTTISTNSTPVISGLFFSWNPSLFPPDIYTIRLKVTDTNLRSFEDRALLIADTTLLPGWPQQITTQTFFGLFRSFPNLVDIDNNNDGEVFFQNTEIPEPLANKFYALNHDTSAVSGWPITFSPPGSDGIENSFSPAIANIDGDSNLEIAFITDNFVFGATPPYSAVKIFVYEENGVSQPGWPVTLADTRAFFTSPVIADIGGNSNKEIIFVTYDYGGSCGGYNFESKIYVYQQNGQPFPGWPQTVPCYSFATPAIGDIDNNGDKEIVVATYRIEGFSNSGFLYAFNHDGTQFPGWPQQVASIYWSSPVLANIDQNDNGKLEIVQSGTANNGLYLALQVLNHDGTSVPGFPLTTVGPSSYEPVIADIDNNGDLEMIFSTGNFLYVVNHDATIFPGWPVFTGFATTGDSPIVANIDGVGNKEVLIADWRKLYGFHSNGAPIQGFPKPLKVEMQAVSPVAGRFNGNNLMDVALIDKNANMYVWELGGAPTSANLPWPMFHHDPQHTGKYP